MRQRHFQPVHGRLQIDVRPADGQLHALDADGFVGHANGDDHFFAAGGGRRFVAHLQKYVLGADVLLVGDVEVGRGTRFERIAVVLVVQLLPLFDGGRRFGGGCGFGCPS